MSQLARWLEEAAIAYAEREKREKIIRHIAVMAADDTEVFDELLEYLLDKDFSEVVGLAMTVIGYPKNARAISRLLNIVVDSNHPGAPEAFEAIQTAPPDAVAPAAIEVLWQRSEEITWWRNDVSGLAYLLKHLGPNYARLCGSTLAFLLGERHRRQDTPVAALIDILAVIGAEYAPYATPALVAVLNEQQDVEVQDRARQLLAVFPPSELAPYVAIMEKPQAPTSIEVNKTLINRYLRFYRTADPALADDLFAPDFIDHAHPEMLRGLEGALRLARQTRAAFSRTNLTVRHLLSEGDLAAFHFRLSGTHTGQLDALAPTGKRVLIEGIDLIRVADGRIAELWSYQNTVAMLRQLGYTFTVPAQG